MNERLPQIGSKPDPMRGLIEQRFALHNVSQAEIERAVPALREALLSYDGRVNAAGDQMVIRVAVEMEKEEDLVTHAVEVVDAALDGVGLPWAQKRSWTGVHRTS